MPPRDRNSLLLAGIVANTIGGDDAQRTFAQLLQDTLLTGRQEASDRRFFQQRNQEAQQRQQQANATANVQMGLPPNTTPEQRAQAIQQQQQNTVFNQAQTQAQGIEGGEGGNVKALMQQRGSLPEGHPLRAAIDRRLQGMGIQLDVVAQPGPEITTAKTPVPSLQAAVNRADAGRATRRADALEAFDPAIVAARGREAEAEAAGRTRGELSATPPVPEGPFDRLPGGAEFTTVLGEELDFLQTSGAFDDYVNTLESGVEAENLAAQLTDLQASGDIEGRNIILNQLATLLARSLESGRLTEGDIQRASGVEGRAALAGFQALLARATKGETILPGEVDVIIGVTKQRRERGRAVLQEVIDQRKTRFKGVAPPLQERLDEVLNVEAFDRLGNIPPSPLEGAPQDGRARARARLGGS